MRRCTGFLWMALVALMPGGPAQAAFHFMQIEQVIGGVNGDTTAQAVQLRMRSAGQNVVSSTRIYASDAAGANRILLKDMTANVPNGQAGRRVLLTTASFANYTNIPLVKDFAMDNAIPSSYLTAGSLTFEDDFGTVYWRLSWGGAGYTGSNSGSFTNDSDGNFGPPVNGPLPSTTLQALRFSGTASAASTTNLAQYALTAGAATFINNANTSFVVTAPPGLPGDFNDNGTIDAADYVLWRKHVGTNFDLNGNGDETGASAGTVDAADYALWRSNFGDTSPGSGSAARMAPLPEPASWTLLAAWAYLAAGRRRRRMFCLSS